MSPLPSVLITFEYLRHVMRSLPADRASAMLPHLRRACAEFDITTGERVAAFLAQLAHESMELKHFEEIASGAAYEGRQDLGNVQPGDGPLFKGRGPIQLTGRANYREAGRALKLPLEEHPELAALPEHGFRIAGWYWARHGLNRLADQRRFDEITRRINGGFKGWKQRVSYYGRAL